jgi:hypothetical protein
MYCFFILLHCVFIDFLQCETIVEQQQQQRKNSNSFHLQLLHDNNHTIRLLYNLTTNYSYYMTFRSFADRTLKFGPYSATFRPKQYSLNIVHTLSNHDLPYLFIICFYFLLRIDELDIQCRDIRSSMIHRNRSSTPADFLPTYNPLFVPLMYALSVLMLLPVIIQHHRRKKVLILQREKQLQRLSLTTVDNDIERVRSACLSTAKKPGTMSTDIELVEVLTDKMYLADIDEHVHLSFTLENLQPYEYQCEVDTYENPRSTITADDCIAHLLDSTPWKTSHIDSPALVRCLEETIVSDYSRVTRIPHVPTIQTYNVDDNNMNDHLLIVQAQNLPKIIVHDTFIESDV